MWDRFDDAMDDLTDEAAELVAAGRQLVARLQKLGVEAPGEPADDHTPARSGADGRYDRGVYMQSAYGGMLGRVHELREWVDALQKLLDASATPPARATKRRPARKRKATKAGAAKAKPRRGKRG